MAHSLHSPHGCSDEVLAHQGLELLDQLGAAGRGERRRDADVLQPAVGVQAEQQRAEQRPLGRRGLVLPVAGDDDVRGALVLDLQHRAAVGGVRRPERLGDDAVEPGALERAEPLLGLGRVARRPGQVDRGYDARERLLEPGPAHLERLVDQRLVAEREQVEGHEAGRRLLRQHPHPRVGGVDPLLQPLELEPVADAHEDLAVDDAALGQRRLHRLDHLGEVAGQRLGVAAGQLDLVPVAEHEGPEPVPLGLEQQAAVLGGVGDALHGLGEHRLDRRHHREIHPVIVG